MSSEKKRLEIKERINLAVSKWDVEKTLSNYARDYFSMKEICGTQKISKVLEKVYELAISAESEDIQLRAIKEIRETLTISDIKEKSENTQINFYQNAAGHISDNVAKLINVSSPTKTIDTII